MSGWGAGRGRGGSRVGRGSSRTTGSSTTVSVSRPKGSATYSVRDKSSRSMSELGSLTDISATELSGLDVHLESSLLKRLFREYLEVRKYKLRNVTVEPLMNDFTKWHGNIVGPAGTPYEGGIFHFIISFSSDHPRTPPSVSMQTRIEHPCVSYSTVKLDILQVLDTSRRNFVAPTTTISKYGYWYPGYTTLTILLALEALLYEGTVDIALRNLSDLSEYESSKAKFLSGIKFSVEQSHHFSCTSCKHRPRKPWPPLNDDYKPVTRENNDFLYLEKATCFFSQKTYEEAALGIGINCTKDARSGAVQTARCVPYVVSLSSFKGSKVKNVWGQQFFHWMPIYIANYSPERSLHLAKRSLSTIYTGSHGDFLPSMALDFFPRLFGTCLVGFFQAADGTESLNYLRSYSYMHRLFLQFIKEYPSLINDARDIVTKFIEQPDTRQDCSVIGTLLTYITITGQKWSQLMDAYMYDLMDRNAKRVIKEFPELNTTEASETIDAQRVSKSFSAFNITGLRFTMFHLIFNRVFLNPEQTDMNSVIQKYDKHYSLLPTDIEDQLLEQIEPITAINNFNDVFRQVGWKTFDDRDLSILLRQAIDNSLRKHYHGGKGIDVLSPEEFEKQRLGSIRPLKELVEEKETEENDWKEYCSTRFGLTNLPETYSTIPEPWKHLYLQHNLQEFVGKLNENPDFKLLYETINQSKDCLTHFDLVTFNPDNIKSQYFFLSRIIELLPQLSHLTISKGETSLGEKGFKELVKGLAKSSGSLQVLDMRYLGIQPNHVSKLAESHLTSEGLTTLHLEGNQLSTDGTVKLSQLLLKHHSLANLSELNLRACQISDTGMKALAKALLVKRNIRKLDLSKNPASRVGIAKIIRNLAYNPCIEEVNLSGMSSVSNSRDMKVIEALALLFKLTVSLKKLVLWKTNIGQCLCDTSMKELAENQTLTTLDLGSAGGIVNDSLGLVLGSKDSKLTELDLGSASLSADRCRAIFLKAKKQSSCVNTLNLFNNKSFLNIVQKTSPKDYNIMIEFLSVTFVNVTDLNVSLCNINSDGAQILGEVLSRNIPLARLDISKNDIGKHGARFIANGLMKNTHLKTLRLDKNNIRSAGTHFLASVLKRSDCMLEELSLFCNFIDVPGAMAIADALKKNKNLRILDLGLNKIRKRGAAAIKDMLSVNTTLETIGLKFNYIPDPSAIQIIKQIVEAKDSKVKDVRLAGNSLQYETLVTIVGLLQESGNNIQFDLSLRAKYLDPEKMERTVYVSPLPANITPDMIKKMFYTNKCGAITAVTIEKHKKKKAAYAKSMYAVVAFAHPDSVELAVDLMKNPDANVGLSHKPRIVRAGLRH